MPHRPIIPPIIAVISAAVATKWRYFHVFNRILQTVLQIYAGNQAILNLDPGENVTLPPGRFSEGGKHYTFTINVVRDPEPTQGA